MAGPPAPLVQEVAGGPGGLNGPTTVTAAVVVSMMTSLPGRFGLAFVVEPYRTRESGWTARPVIPTGSVPTRRFPTKV